MQQFFLFVDKISTKIGHAFSWLIMALTLLITFEVFSRYVLDKPHSWAFDLMIMMYGSMFMMAGAYTLAAGGHVRGGFRRALPASDSRRALRSGCPCAPWSFWRRCRRGTSRW